MKIKNLLTGLILTILISGQVIGQSQGVSITTDNSSPDVTAMLDIVSQDKGLLIPRMPKAYRDLINDPQTGKPATGLLIFQTDNTPGFYFYDGTQWQLLQTKAIETLTTHSATELNDITNIGSGQIITQAERDKLNSISGVPVGTIIPFGGPNIPDGWLLCDGSVANQSQYVNLYTAIGTSWGSGDNSGGSFNLPDLRGQFLRGKDNGTGNDPDVANRTKVDGTTVIGDLVGSYQSDAFEKHTHQTGWFQAGIDLINGSAASGAGTTAAYNSTNRNLAYSSSTGGSTETRPKNASVNYIIKY